METWEAIDSIRVVRDFDKRDVPTGDIERIVNAGRRAGSSKNLQRWAFVVVRNGARLERLAQTGPWAGHLTAAAFAIALVSANPRGLDAPLSVIWDLGRAAQNMVLAAWDIGIGSCPATVYEHDLVRRELAIPADQHCEYILSFGYPSDPSVFEIPKARGGRRTLREVFHDEKW